MYSGDAPPSFSSAGVNGYDQEQIHDQFQVSGDVYNQPPSYGALGHGQGNSHNHFQQGIAYRGLDQPDNTEAPSFTALGHGNGHSYNQDGNLDRELGNSSGQPLSIGAMGKAVMSQTSGGVDPYDGEKAPNLSDVNRRESSQTGGSEAEFEVPDHEFVGMSLVGKNFKRFYPNAYYKEKDDYNYNSDNIQSFQMKAMGGKM